MAKLINPALCRRIEEASLNAWPALQQILFDGWILRFSKGYTKRANSVNPLFTSHLDIENKIGTCERLYEEKGLPPVFRITPFVSPPNLDRVLERHHYRKIDPTSVLYLDLTRHATRTQTGHLREESLDGWLQLFSRMTDSPPEKQQIRREILQGMPVRRLPVSLVVEGQAVSCAVGALEGDLLGVFDLVTDPRQRRKGYATSLVSSLLEWAQTNGARCAYLQVAFQNAPAHGLYTKLGFREAYQYWYRVADTAGVVR